MLSPQAGKLRRDIRIKTAEGKCMNRLQIQLKAGGSTIALVTASFFAPAAYAQNGPAAPVEEVTVTGTSIRGLAPIGSNLITVDQQQITDVGAVTMSEVLANVPAITGMGNSGRGSNGNGGAGASVYIHQIGASAPNNTLVIMDDQHPGDHGWPSPAGGRIRQRQPRGRSQYHPAEHAGARR